MNSSDMIPKDDRTPQQADEDFNQHIPRSAADPFAPDDIPLALLEFHSPTAGLVNLPATPSARYVILLIGGCLWHPWLRWHSSRSTGLSQHPGA